jgi:hypothetical protein
MKVLLIAGLFHDLYFLAFSAGEDVKTVKKSKFNFGLSQTIDILFMVNICLTFIKVYKDEGPVRDLGKIVWNYLTSNFVFDMVATLPGLITNQSPGWYLIKLIRFKDFPLAVRNLYDLLHSVLTLLGFRKTVVEKIGSGLTHLMQITVIVFLLASFWVYLGRTSNTG